MEYRIGYPDELYHYGVKGMKWGVRHDPERVGRRPKKIKPLSAGDRKRSRAYMKKYGVSRSEAEAAVRKRNKMLKNVAIGTAVTAGVIIGGVALAKYGREYCDDVIKAGKEMRTVHMDENIIDRGKFYTTQKKLDALKYKGLFGQANTMFGVPVGPAKKQIIAKSTKDIKVAGVKNAEKVYNQLLSNNKEFASALKDVPNGSPVDYKKFNHYGLLGDGSALGVKDAKKAQKIFTDELKKRGYGAVADWNDRANSGFRTRANIVFDTSNIKRESVRQMSIEEVRKARTKAYKIHQIEERYKNPGWVAYDTAIAGGTTAGVLSAKQNRELAKQGAARKKKKK